MTLLRSRDADVVALRDRSESRRFLLLLVFGVVVVRATYVLQPLRSDEGGYLLVARQWHAGGEFLYGDYHVDRPPLLMLLFRAAALTDWDPMIRVVAIPFAVAFVVAAWHAGWLLAGRSAARWSTLVAAGLMCSPAIGADQADGELFAAAFVMASVALALSAWNSEGVPHKFLLAVVAGLLAGAAPLVKQNFLEGLLFAGALVLASAWSRRRVGHREVSVAAGVFLGALVPHAVVWLWATTLGIEPISVWQDLVGFRADAFDVIWSARPQASLVRGGILLALGLVTGVLLAVLTWLVSWRPRREKSVHPEHWALTAILVFGMLAIAAGGSYWVHYLLQLATGVVLATGVLAPAATRAGRWMRASARAVVATAVLGSLLVGVVYLTVPWVWFQKRTGEWLEQSSAPGDTAYIAYGHASILEAADVGSTYPYLWSLPMRTLDPNQDRLRATLAGPEAPTWIVKVNGLDSWGIDDGARLRDVVEQRYRVVAEICGNPVLLRVDLRRQLAPSPRC